MGTITPWDLERKLNSEPYGYGAQISDWPGLHIESVQNGEITPKESVLTLLGIEKELRTKILAMRFVSDPPTAEIEKLANTRFVLMLMQSAVICNSTYIPEVEMWPQDVSMAGRRLDVREQIVLRTLRAAAEQHFQKLIVRCGVCESSFLAQEVYKCGGIRCGHIVCNRCYGEWPEVFSKPPECPYCHCAIIEFEHCIGMYSAMLDSDKAARAENIKFYLSEPEVRMAHRPAPVNG